jgi:preprotein translocase subunit YajC
MDVAALVELIQTLGFPVALVIAMGLFIFKLWKQSAEREKTLYAELAKCREVNEKAIVTISQYAEKIGAIQEDVKEIKEDITHITAIMEHE